MLLAIVALTIGSKQQINQPSNKALGGLEQSSFQGTTLRGLLLEGYAFWTVGQVMLWGAVASFILAAVMLVLVGLGFRHARRTPPAMPILTTRETDIPQAERLA